ncbi:MAG: choice-of-anchor B family protein [Saprospiraceae bacterium]
MDISFLPDSVALVYDSDILLRRAHNIFIDTARATLYTLATSGGPQSGSAMRIYDLSTPDNPQFLGAYNQFGGLTAGHVHDAFVQNGIAYLNCGFDGMAVVDFNDPLNPQTLGILTDYIFAGYNHSGWPSVDGQYYYLGDETHGFPLKVVDVSDPTDMEVVATIGSLNPDLQQTIPHNQLVACNYLYVSYYYEGLMVYDISDPAAPQPVLYYDTSAWPFDFNYRGAWGVYPFLPSGNILVSDMQEGLFVLSGPGDVCDNREESREYCGLVADNEPVVEDTPWSVFPQPARHSLTLVGQDMLSPLAQLQLFNNAGSLVHTFTNATDDTLLLPNLPAGLYWLRVADDKNIQLLKVLIQ